MIQSTQEDASDNDMTKCINYLAIPIFNRILRKAGITEDLL